VINFTIATWDMKSIVDGYTYLK